jgi:hypothetical protein
MDEQKSLLLEIAEAVVRHLRRRVPQVGSAPSERYRPRWLRWVGRHMVPNVGTLLMVIVLLLTVPSLAAPLHAPAATSTSTISYQGRLADSSGNPLTSKYNLEFRIYSVPTGGTPLWTEMWTGGNAVDISDGLFNVMLGSINSTLASAIAGRNELYLGITVGTDSEMAPRVQLGSVPFSMQAMTVNGMKIEVFTVTCNNSGGCDYWFTAGFNETPMILKSAFDHLDISDYGPNPTNHETLHAVSQPNSTHSLMAIGR